MDFLSQLFGGIQHLLGGGGGNQQQATGAAPAQSGGGGPMGLFQNPGQGLAGLGIMGLGQLLSPKVQAPDFGNMQSVQNLQNWNSSASHPLDPNVAKSIQDSANIQNEQQLRNLRDTYKNARPGTDYTTDSAYQRDLANLNHQMSQNTSDAMANAQLSSNQQNLGNMTNLAGLDVGKAMTQYGQQAAQKQNFNQGFGNIGSMFLQKGLGMPNYGGMMDMFNQNSNKKAA